MKVVNNTATSAAQFKKYILIHAYLRTTAGPSSASTKTSFSSFYKLAYQYL